MTDSHSSGIDVANPTSMKPTALASAPIASAARRPMWSDNAPTSGDPKSPSAEDADVIVPMHTASHPSSARSVCWYGLITVNPAMGATVRTMMMSSHF